MTRTKQLERVFQQNHLRLVRTALGADRSDRLKDLYKDLAVVGICLAFVVGAWMWVAL